MSHPKDTGKRDKRNCQSSEEKSFYRSGTRTIERPVAGRRPNSLGHRPPSDNDVRNKNNHRCYAGHCFSNYYKYDVHFKITRIARFRKKCCTGTLCAYTNLWKQPFSSSFVYTIFFHFAGVKPNQIRCGEHSDYGSITLLFQDDVGGLEVC